MGTALGTLEFSQQPPLSKGLPVFRRTPRKGRQCSNPTGVTGSPKYHRGRPGGRRYTEVGAGAYRKQPGEWYMPRQGEDLVRDT